MNLISGTVTGGIFTYKGGTMQVATADGPVTLGVRPEDIALSHGDADIEGKVYSSELLGDCTLVNVRVGDSLVAAKVGADEGMEMDTPVGLKLRQERLHFFDTKSGNRRET